MIEASKSRRVAGTNAQTLPKFTDAGVRWFVKLSAAMPNLLLPFVKVFVCCFVQTVPLRVSYISVFLASMRLQPLSDCPVCQGPPIGDDSEARHWSQSER